LKGQLEIFAILRVDATQEWASLEGASIALIMRTDQRLIHGPAAHVLAMRKPTQSHDTVTVVAKGS
jgi:hypothetical protein